MRIDPDRISRRLKAMGKDPSDGGQTWLAKQVGMKPQGIQSIMAGKSHRPRKLKEIAAALETTEDYLLGLEEENPPPACASTLAIRISQLFADLMKTSLETQEQVADLVERKLRPVSQNLATRTRIVSRD